MKRVMAWAVTANPVVMWALVAVSLALIGAGCGLAVAASLRLWMLS